MTPSVNKTIRKTWLGIGTVAMLLASSAATSPVVAAPGRIVAATEARVHRQAHPIRPAMPRTAAPQYYGRPTEYAPAYPPGPFVLFTPFFD